MTSTIGGEKQAGISGGVNPPADIASSRAHIVRWTMVLRRPKRSVDLQRCAVEVCHAIAWRAPRSKNAEAFLKVKTISGNVR